MNNFFMAAFADAVDGEDHVNDDPLVYACMARDPAGIRRAIDDISDTFAQTDGYPDYKRQGLSKFQVIEKEVNRKDSHSRTALHAAAFMGEQACVKILLEAGANVGAKDKNWVTPLHWACCIGSVPVASLLLQRSDFLTLNSVDRELRQSPLHVAAGNGHEKVCELLIDHLRGSVDGSKVLTQINSQDRKGRTPLHLSAYNGYVNVIKLLVNKGAQVEKRDKGGRTALHWAAFRGHHAATVELLRCDALVQAVDHADSEGRTAIHAAALSGSIMCLESLMGQGGANAAVRDGRGLSPLHLAVSGGKFKCVAFLLGLQRDITSVDNQGQSALHKAVSSMESDFEMVDSLLEAGLSPKQKDNKGRSPLHLACKQGDLESVLILLRAWPEGVNDKDNSGNSCIHYAARFGHAAVIDLLLSQDANINAVGEHGMTALHISALFGFVECIQFLLSKQANIHAVDEFGRSALHSAAFRGVTEAVEILIENGIKCKLVDRQGRNALHYGAISNVTPTCEVILHQLPLKLRVKADSFGRTPLHYAAAVADRSQCLVSLLKENASVLVRDKKQLTPIHVLCMHGHYRSLERLFDMLPLTTMQSSVNSLDIHMRTPLHYAAHGGHSAVVEVLLRIEGLNLEVLDCDQRTPISLAAASGSAQCMILLMEAGASCNHQDVNGYTPIMAAAMHKSISCVKSLLDSADATDDESDEESQGPADLSIVDNNDRTVLMHAVNAGAVECVNTLLDCNKLNVNDVDHQGQTALHIALRSAEYVDMDDVNDIVEALFRHEADVHVKDSHGRTPLHFAAIYGCEDILRNLIEENGGTANIVDNKGRTPLHYACYSGHESCVSCLMDEEVVSRNENENKFGPLHCAAVNGHANCLEALVEDEELVESLNISGTDVLGRTALHVAATQGDAECVRILTRFEDLDVNKRNGQGKTALILASENGNHEAAALLVEAGADFTDIIDGQSILHLAYSEKAPLGAVVVLEAVLDRLQSEGKNPVEIAALLDSKSTTGESILLLACSKHDVETVRCLQEHGARTDIADSSGWSPLHRLIPSGEGRRCLDLLINNLEISDTEV